MKFKSIALITNTFLGDTIVARGIYTNTHYDYDIYNVQSIAFNHEFSEFMLVTEKPIHSSLVARATLVMDEAEPLEQAILKLLTPTDIDFHKEINEEKNLYN